MHAHQFGYRLSAVSVGQAQIENDTVIPVLFQFLDCFFQGGRFFDIPMPNRAADQLAVSGVVVDDQNRVASVRHFNWRAHFSAHHIEVESTFVLEPVEFAFHTAKLKLNPIEPRTDTVYFVFVTLGPSPNGPDKSYYCDGTTDGNCGVLTDD